MTRSLCASVESSLSLIRMASDTPSTSIPRCRPGRLPLGSGGSVFVETYTVNKSTNPAIACPVDHQYFIDIPQQAPETPAAGFCFYKISGGNETAKQSKCESTLCGNPPALGVWLNFDDGSHNVLDNHCKYTVPGISNDKFQLTPGQSDPSCLSKNDD